MVVVGRILSPWGTKGYLKVELLTDFPERFMPGRRLYLQGRPLVIEALHQQAGHLFLKLDVVNSREESQGLRGQLLEIPEAELTPLPDGDYYWFQILGLEVWTTQGEVVGKIADILRTPANDVFLVRHDGREILIPAVADVVQEVDLSQGKMVIEAIAGLLTGG